MKPLALISRLSVDVLNSIISSLNTELTFVEGAVREFVDASVSNVNKFLPNGDTNTKTYLFVKTDSSGNTVTVYPFGSQQINATTSFVLSSQGDSVILAYDKASQSWWSV